MWCFVGVTCAEAAGWSRVPLHERGEMLRFGEGNGVKGDTLWCESVFYHLTFQVNIFLSLLTYSILTFPTGSWDHRCVAPYILCEPTLVCETWKAEVTRTILSLSEDPFNYPATIRTLPMFSLKLLWFWKFNLHWRLPDRSISTAP